MSKTEYAWVIQRNDGYFFAGENCKGDVVFCDNFNIFDSAMHTKKECKNIIKFYNLQNCRPVKVKIEIVGEDDE